MIARDRGAKPIRVLVVDDSAFVRKVLRELLSASPGIEVVGVARDGLEALEQIAALTPDVVTLDLIMPELDGFGVLAMLPKERRPRVVAVSTHEARSVLGLAALEAGAVDLVHKPTAIATDQLYDIGAELVAKVRAAGVARAPDPLPPPPEQRSTPVPSPAPRAHGPRPIKAKVVVIGTSTGGPQALARLLSALPPDFPVPLAIALHIPPGYTADLARRLDQRCALHVVEASDGLVLRPGLVVLARAGMHLRLSGGADGPRAHVEASPRQMLYYPSVDVLFQSAAEVAGTGAIGVLLTGMGDDGCKGAQAIRAAGGVVLTEAESSCVVYGMPRSAVEAGASTASCAIDNMVEEILRWI